MANLIESLNVFNPVFLAGTLLIGFMFFLFLGFNIILNSKLDPITKNQSRFDKEIKDLKAGQAELSKEIAEIKQLLKK